MLSGMEIFSYGSRDDPVKRASANRAENQIVVVP
jgi:hypothetical protein